MTSAVDLAVPVHADLWRDADLAPPDLSQAPQLNLETWKSARADDGAASLAWGCFAGDASAWSADATDLAQGKLAEIASGTAARMRGAAAPMHVVASARDGRDRTLVADAGIGRARTLVVFTRDAPHAHGCFVACTSDACVDAIDETHVTGAIVAPPPPGLALRSLALAVHHPRGALGVLGAIVVCGAALAIVTRPGKRRR
jgi:hypothetical protein